MRLENKFIQVENSAAVINRVNYIAGAFGWSAVSVQITDSSVAYESGAIGWATAYGTYVHKTISVQRTTYANITYQRDIEDPRHPEWVMREREYDKIEASTFLTEEDEALIDEIYDKLAKRRVMKIIIGVAIGVLAVVLMMVFMGLMQTIYILATFFPLGLVILLGYAISHLIWKRDPVLKKLHAHAGYQKIMAQAAARKNAAKEQVLDYAWSL